MMTNKKKKREKKKEKERNRFSLPWDQSFATQSIFNLYPLRGTFLTLLSNLFTLWNQTAI